ncbi:MAG: HAD-IC family P-type ATPase [Clostridia bacterium]|nr:HAD-IC family P-type ATPase [Clostridia bacterium]
MATEYLGDEKLVFFKGAPEIIVQDSNLSSSQKNAIFSKITNYQKSGKRVIAFSSFVGKWTGDGLTGGKADFDGFAVISDPVRKDVKKSVELCKTAGIEVMMMTGDNKETATSIAKELNIISSDKQVVLGEFIDGLDKNTLKRIIKGIKVVARSTPTTKLKIVETLKSLGEVVAVTGDGVNDAPAIERADIGIAMGSGSEITKEASDIVLLDDSFSTIVKAISFGRNIYCNFQRFITFQLTVNVTAMLVVIASLVVGMENPFTSVQLLWIDIIMDGPPALTLAMERDKGKFMNRNPVRRSDGILTKTMTARIIFQGCFMALIIMFEYLYDFLGVGLTKVPTAVFCIFVIFQLFNAFNCRKIGSESIFSGFGDNKLMVYTFGATFLFQIVMTQFLGGFIGTTPLPLNAWLKIIGVCLLTVVFSESYKLFYRILKNGKIFLTEKRRKLN